MIELDLGAAGAPFIPSVAASLAMYAAAMAPRMAKQSAYRNECRNSHYRCRPLPQQTTER